MGRESEANAKKRKVSATYSEHRHRGCICGEKMCRNQQIRYERLANIDTTYAHRAGYRKLSTVPAIRENALIHLGDMARRKANSQQNC